MLKYVSRGRWQSHTYRCVPDCAGLELHWGAGKDSGGCVESFFAAIHNSYRDRGEVAGGVQLDGLYSLACAEATHDTR